MKTAAGIVLYRFRGSGGSRQRNAPQLLIGHLGGPYYAKKEARGWTLPKGLVEEGEDLEAAARREWREETGTEAPAGVYAALPPVKQSGKVNHLFLVEGDADADALASDTFRLQWPPRSGRYIDVPEVDRWAWVDLATAEAKLTKSLSVAVAHVRAALAT